MDHQSAVDRRLTERYVLDELEEAELTEFEEHFFECTACAEDVLRATSLVANIKAVLRENVIPVIEIGPADRFLTLTIGIRTELSRVNCEIQCEADPAPIVLEGVALGGSLHLHLPAGLLAAGPCTAVVRDRSSGKELERREFLISKKLHKA